MENEKINEKEWAIIYGLIQDLRLIKKDLVSVGFKDRIQLQLKQNIENNALNLLYKMAAV